jgi:hypothetical protein
MHLIRVEAADLPTRLVDPFSCTDLRVSVNQFADMNVTTVRQEALPLPSGESPNPESAGAIPPVGN